MFQKKQFKQKQQKLCSISNFSDNSSFYDDTQQEINNNTIKKYQQSTKKAQKSNNNYTKPVFIITPNFQSKHINQLTQLFQSLNVPIQYQHQTDSLGCQMNTTFFVVVDNKNGSRRLGPQFNSVLVNIVGYPKKGPNKNYLYCEKGQQVLEQYKEFVKYKSRNEQNFQDKVSKLEAQQSLLKSGSHGFSSLISQTSNIRLKSISKYHKKGTQQKSKNKQTSNKPLLSSSSNKENITTLKQLYGSLRTSSNIPFYSNINNLYFIQSIQDQQFNNIISKYYYEIKLLMGSNIDKKNNQERLFYYRCEKDLVCEFLRLSDKLDTKSMKSFLKDEKLFYVVMTSEMALKFSSRVNSQFYHMRNKIKFVSVILPHKDVQPKKERQDMLVIKKAFKSNLFECVVFSDLQFQKALKNLGFFIESKEIQSIIKQSQNKKLQKQPQSLIKSNKKLLQQKSNKKIKWSQNTKQNTKQYAQKQSQQDLMSFCPVKLQQSQVSIDINIKQTYNNNLFIISPKFVKQNKTFQNGNVKQNNLQFEIPWQNSIRQSEKNSNIKGTPTISHSPGQSSLSSLSKSKIKFIKVTKTQKSGINPNIPSHISQNIKPQSISQKNEQYCMSQNKQLVQKLKTKISKLKGSLSSPKSIRSQNQLYDYPAININQPMTPRLNSLSSHGSNSSQAYSRSKIKSFSKASSLKSIKNTLPFIKQKQTSKQQIQNEYLCKNKRNEGQNDITKSKEMSKPKQFRKLKMKTIKDEQFVTRCSQIQFIQSEDSLVSNNRTITKSRINNSKNNSPSVTEQYYFGSSQQSHKIKWQDQSPQNALAQSLSQSSKQHQAQKTNLVNGMIYVQYNQIISSIISCFKQNCPQSIICKQNIKPFYLARQYSRRIKKIWKNKRNKNILPLLVDTQGLGEINKYYTNLTYEDDDLQFYSTVNQKRVWQNASTPYSSLGNTGKYSVPQNITQQGSIFLLFFTIVTQKQASDQIFTKMDEIALRLPQHQIIKCVVQKDLGDKQMRQKSRQIYQQIFGYLVQFYQQFGEGFVQTR